MEQMPKPKEINGMNHPGPIHLQLGLLARCRIPGSRKFYCLFLGESTYQILEGISKMM